MGLQTAHLTALADLARRIQGDVADFTGHVVPAPVDLPVEDDRRADAVAEVEHHQVPAARAGAKAVLCQRHRLTVVFHHKGIAGQGLLQLGDHRHAPPAKIGGKLQLAPLNIQDAGHHHSHGFLKAHVLVGCKEAAQMFRHPGQHLLGRKVHVGDGMDLLTAEDTGGTDQSQVQTVPVQKYAGTQQMLFI